MNLLKVKTPTGEVVINLDRIDAATFNPENKRMIVYLPNRGTASMELRVEGDETEKVWNFLVRHSAIA